VLPLEHHGVQDAAVMFWNGSRGWTKIKQLLSDPISNLNLKIALPILTMLSTFPFIELETDFDPQAAQFTAERIMGYKFTGVVI
jgi:hypothetical protein